MKDEDLIVIARGVAAGMVHLSAEGIVHRDLAARNILLTSSLTPKIADFGLSRFGNVNPERNAVGPVRWMSPESLSSQSFNEKSDVWSYGCLCYELVARQEPFPGVPQNQVVSRVSQGELKPIPPANAPAVISLLIIDCTKFNPTERPSFRDICNRFQ